MPWRVQGTVVSWANCSAGVPSCPAQPPRPAVRRPDPTPLVVCPGFGFDMLFNGKPCQGISIQQLYGNVVNNPSVGTLPHNNLGH